MSKPLVSILIISFNQEAFIEEALKSALEQDYENLEVVVADDGSTDRTPDIILSYAERYKGRLIAIVGEPNLGITGNSNRGLRLCEGKYVAFQGGDDVLLPGKITAQVAWMEEDDTRVLCGHQVEVFYEDGSPSHLLLPSLPSGKGASWLIENGVPYGATSIMVRAESIPSKGFDERLPSVSDYMLWIDCLRGENKEFGYIQGVYASYRRHSQNVTNDSWRCYEDLQRTFDILETEYAGYEQSIKKGRRNQLDVERAKLLLAKGKFIQVFFIMLRTYISSPSRLWRTLAFKLRKMGWW
ncbi:glycosyltransferase [Ghiorsea bivora]|uniref:glycosyltransferase n=1 Tax=Ghiorsea bivora TaxID=1485545 RepID=UPI0006902650|nr:glycosyltransferase [Ghiorsea bivora]